MNRFNERTEEEEEEEERAPSEAGVEWMEWAWAHCRLTSLYFANISY